MERIKKALDKAQKQRDNSTSQQIPSAHKLDTQSIAYSQTRNIDVSDEWLKENRIVAGSDDPRSDLYKILRTKVLQRMQKNDSHLLAVTSPTRGVGKSFSAINLAISIAMDANYSVLLADLDFRSPRIHEYLGIPAEPGLSEYFSGEKTIQELMVHPGSLENLVVLPAGRPVKRSSDLLSTPVMLELINELKHRYPDRIVIVDLPPLLQTDDAMIFMPNVDACVLVVADGENTKEQIRNSIELIGEEKHLGVLLNKSTEESVVDEKV